MSRIFITGSADGLGHLAAKALAEQGHQVALHARNAERGREAMKRVPRAETVFTGDLSSIEETTKLGEEVNKSGHFDAVIHNAGIYTGPSKNVFTVNTLAPYILTCLIDRPHRLIFMSSGLHLQGRPKLNDFRLDTTSITYSDTKLHVVMLAMAVAENWPHVYSNSVNPGWVPTKMGGKSAPDDLQKGYETQVWLATSDDKEAKVSGRYFFHQQQKRHNSEADNADTREQLLLKCHELTGIPFPR